MNLVLPRITPPNPAKPSPSAGRWQHLILLAALLALWLPAAALDLPLARFVKAHRAPGELHKLLAMSEVFAHGLGIVAIVATAAALDARGWRILPRLTACSLGAGLAADTLKLLMARYRPRAAPLDGSLADTFAGWLPAWNDRLPHAWDASLQSLPSGHTAAGVGLAVALATLYPRGRWLFACFALLAALQRIESQSHFLSDIVAGAAVGILVSLACTCGWLGKRLASLETHVSPPPASR